MCHWATLTKLSFPKFCYAIQSHTFDCNMKKWCTMPHCIAKRISYRKDGWGYGTLKRSWAKSPQQLGPILMMINFASKIDSSVAFVLSNMILGTQTLDHPPSPSITITTPSSSRSLPTDTFHSLSLWRRRIWAIFKCHIFLRSLWLVWIDQHIEPIVTTKIM